MKMLKNFFKISWKTESADHAISELDTDDINKNILAVLRTFSNLQKKKNYEKHYTKETASEAATTEFLNKITNRK